MAKWRLLVSVLLLCVSTASYAEVDPPVRYAGREAFVAMDSEAPPRNAVRAGAMEGVVWGKFAFHAVSPKPGQTIADIGFGQGRITLELAAAVGPSGRVIARDIGKRRLEVLQWRIERDGVSNVEAALSQTDNVLIAPAQIDVALLSDVYQIIVQSQDETKNAFLRSLYTAMKPGGVVVVANVAAGDWAKTRKRDHETTVRDFARNGFIVGQRFVFPEGEIYRAEILEFQRPAD